MYLLFIAPAFLFSLIAGFLTKSTFKKYSGVRTLRGMTGAEAAQMVLARAGIRDVTVVPHNGYLTDHYNPSSRQLALSEPVYGSTSIAAVGVACHEAGHAVQHAESYKPMWIRSILVPTANIGSNLGYLVMLGGLIFSRPGMIVIGALLFSAVLLFQIVTLPVEFDASARAKKLAFEYGIVTEGERAGVSRVLNAAAMTYVAAASATLMTLLYFLIRGGILGGRD
jgi:hypothetical protein